MLSGMPDGSSPGEQSPMEALEKQTSASVWSAIRYLDSASNYRECLHCENQSAFLEESELILLDDVSKNCWGQLLSVTLTAGFACLALLLVMQS